MSEYNWDDFESDDNDGDGGNGNVQPDDVKSLPKHLRQLIAKAKADEKAAKQRADVAESQLRKKDIESVLSSKSVPAKVAELIPSDVAATPEGVTAWLEKFGDVFGTPATQNASEGDSGAAQDTAQTSDIGALSRMQQTASSGTAPGGSMADLMAKLQDPTLTKEQLDALILGGSAA